MFLTSDAFFVQSTIQYYPHYYPILFQPGETHSLLVEVALLELVCKPPHCPFVMELIEWYETAQYFILVMERPDPCIKMNTPNDIKVQILMIQVAMAASHCFDRGVFHRYIKEENIIINPLN